MKNDKTVIIRMPKSLDEFLTDVTEYKYTTKSAYIRDLIRKDWLKEMKKVGKEMGYL